MTLLYRYVFVKDIRVRFIKMGKALDQHLPSTLLGIRMRIHAII